MKFLKQEPLFYHVIGCCYFDHWPGFYEGVAWDIFSEAMDDVQDEANLTTRSFVLMNNHYHWLLNHDFTQDSGIVEWFHELVNFKYLHYFQADFVGHAFQQEIEIIPITNIKNYQTVYKYIYRNPVTAGLCEKAENYPYSSLAGVLGRTQLDFKCEDNMNLLQSPNFILEWLNNENIISKYILH
ncbi:MAG: hypothetical protein KDD58_14085 [Bdellovibrionales bacterium]|nr:hypothetical protein [Bdellovibrionales bacterium]